MVGMRVVVRGLRNRAVRGLGCPHTRCARLPIPTRTSPWPLADEVHLVPQLCVLHPVPVALWRPLGGLGLAGIGIGVLQRTMGSLLALRVHVWSSTSLPPSFPPTLPPTSPAPTRAQAR